MRYLVTAEIVVAVDADSPKEAEKAFYADEYLYIELEQVKTVEVVAR